MEVDTGTAVSLATELAVTSLLSSDVVLQTYTGESILVLGLLPVTVLYALI